MATGSTPHSQAGTYTVNLNAGWNAFSVPVYSPDDTMAEIVGSTCSSSTVWRYDSATGKYSKVGSLSVGSRLPSSVGLLVKVQASCSVTLGGSYQVDFDGLSLYSGWNFIGAPSQPLNFKGVSAACSVTSGLWRYNSESHKYQKAEVLQPGEAYFVKVDGSCTLSALHDEMPPSPE